MVLESFNSFNNNLYTRDIVSGVCKLKDLKPDQDLGLFKLKENIHLIIEEYEIKPEQIVNSLFEVHEHTIDIQYPLTGYEKTYYSALENLKISSEYQKEKDRTHYSIQNNFYSEIITGDNVFAIFYPGEPHSPQKALNGKCQKIKKATIKIKIDVLQVS
jgi:YhcH/YjgK/YiaL family protein